MVRGTQYLFHVCLSVLLLGSIAACEAGAPPANQDAQSGGPASDSAASDSTASSEAAGANGADGAVDAADRTDEANELDTTEPDGGESGIEGAAAGDSAASTSAAASTPRPTSPITIPDEPLHFERPQHVRGIYLNAWASGSSVRTNALMEMAGRTEINSFVIDIKDASGYVSYSTNVALAREIGATDEIRIRDISSLLARLHDAGIYPIARIVVFQDPLLAGRRPDLAIQDSTGGVWMDGSGHSWVNPYHQDVWDYNIALAAEAARLGFPEIQWDYVRFPDASNEDLARSRYPRQDGRKRSIAIRDFLIHGNAGLDEFGVEITADVFGVATSARTDVGIGQLWEDFIDVVNVALPMVYPSHYWTGSFGIQEPNDRPYEIVLAALEAGMRRSEVIPGAGTIRPWLQDFTLGSPRYGAPEVRAQIEATYDAGIQEWILWNASGRYTEAAFAPARGFPEGTDPMIRFGGQVVPASMRFGPPTTAVDESVAPEPPTNPGVIPLPTTLQRPARTIIDTSGVQDTTGVPDTSVVRDTIGG